MPHNTHQLPMHHPSNPHHWDTLNHFTNHLLLHNQFNMLHKLSNNQCNMPHKLSNNQFNMFHRLSNNQSLPLLLLSHNQSSPNHNKSFNKLLPNLLLHNKQSRGKAELSMYHMRKLYSNTKKSDKRSKFQERNMSQIIMQWSIKQNMSHKFIKKNTQVFIRHLNLEYVPVDRY